MRSLACALSPAFAPSAVSADAETVVRYGISLADIPLTSGQPDRGAGAYQFSGDTIYDPLVAWEMNVADRPGKLVPGLAREWKVDGRHMTTSARAHVKPRLPSVASYRKVDDYAIEIATKDVEPVVRQSELQDRVQPCRGEAARQGSRLFA
jgi:peptide/nickel transport system substrate-binding protein